eukprot:3642901-Lingulodinium_polyedra.AAC.1
MASACPAVAPTGACTLYMSCLCSTALESKVLSSFLTGASPRQSGATPPWHLEVDAGLPGA